MVASFDRPELHLTAHLFHDDDLRRREVVERAVELSGKRSADGVGLVYCATRKDTVAYVEELRARGVRAAAYHAGMKGTDRDAVHARFLDGALDVVVATSAFGMGIDKADVRFVVHAASPASLDAYYQEIGRAGRDGDPAAVTLLHHAKDLNLQRFLTARRPKPGCAAGGPGRRRPAEPITPTGAAGRHRARPGTHHRGAEPAGAGRRGTDRFRRSAAPLRPARRRRPSRARARSPSSAGRWCGRASR